jgi:hypothetical protein
MNRIFIQALKIMRSGYRHDFGFANHLTLIACFISYEKWVQREKCLSKTRLPYFMEKQISHKSAEMVILDMSNPCTCRANPRCTSPETKTAE